jgi:type II secretory ATPase GspE/PulE/Tfp pilus assembly ATPase PilB-like protein
LERASQRVVREQAVRSGLRTLVQDGSLKVKAGLTTSEEVMRVAEQ